MSESDYYDGIDEQALLQMELPTAVDVEVCYELVFDMCFVCLRTGMFADTCHSVLLCIACM